MITLTHRYVKQGRIQTKEIAFSKELLVQPYSPSSLFTITVEGTSMQPHILDGAVVVADVSQTTFVDGGIFLVQYEGRLWIKKASLIDGKAVFVSINEDFAHLVYALDTVRIVAKALLTFTNL